MNDTTAIRDIVLENVHGYQSSKLKLNPGLNIIYGKNGTGKTTLLHILVNLLEGDIERFLSIRFKSISVTTYNDVTVRLDQKIINDKPSVSLSVNGKTIGNYSEEVKQIPDIDQQLIEIFCKRPVFFPAYRNVLEGTYRRRQLKFEFEFSESDFNKIVQKERLIFDQLQPHKKMIMREQIEFTAGKTLLCREWFGQFVPTIRYPSIYEVHRQLEEEIETARYIVASQDEKNISSVFKNVLEVVLSKKHKAVEENVDTLLQGVRSYIQDLAPETQDTPTVYAEIASLLAERDFSTLEVSDMIKGILKVYSDALASRSEAKERAYVKIERFISSVNKFLEEKPLKYEYKRLERLSRRALGKSYILLPDGRKASFSVLSSGERHILSLIFAATHMSLADGIVIIDEPELSLHVDWQRIILGEIQKQAGGRQVIACTHSPEVAADHMDKYIELKNELNYFMAQSDDDENPQLEIEIQDN